MTGNPAYAQDEHAEMFSCTLPKVPEHGPFPPLCIQIVFLQSV